MVPLLQELLQGAEVEIDKTRERLYELEAKLQNGEQLRREIEIKQRTEVRRDYELNIQLSPDFEQFLDGLIEMR